MSALFFSRLENRYACRQVVATMNVFVNVEDRAEASR
jgi:hypothetical protein